MANRSQVTRIHELDKRYTNILTPMSATTTANPRRRVATGRAWAKRAPWGILTPEVLEDCFGNIALFTAINGLELSAFRVMVALERGG